MTGCFEQTGVILFVEHYERCVAFYRDVLELAVEEEKPALVRFDFGGAYLMVERGGVGRAESKSRAENPTTLRFNVADIEEAVAWLRAKGVAPEVHRWATTLAESWVAELTARGYQVTGDLAELVPAAPTTSYVDPDHAPADQVADAAIRALGVSVLENARLREVEIELHGVLDDMERQLQRAYSTPVYKVRKRIYEAAKGSSAVRAALDSYRRRGRNSRST